MIRPRSPMAKIATATLVAASSLFVASLAQALDSGPKKADLSANTGRSRSVATKPRTDPKVRAEMVSTAADRDPFQSSRQRGPAYQLPGESMGGMPMMPSASPPDIQVYGTVVSPNCGSALVLPKGASKPRLVSCGDRVQGYRVASIGPETVTFAASDDTPFEIALTPANMRGKQPQGQGKNANAPVLGARYMYDMDRAIARPMIMGAEAPATVMIRSTGEGGFERVEIIKADPAPEVRVVPKPRKRQ